MKTCEMCIYFDPRVYEEVLAKGLGVCTEDDDVENGAIWPIIRTDHIAEDCPCYEEEVE